MNQAHNSARLKWAVAAAVIVGLAIAGLQRLPATASATGVGQLTSQLSQQQARQQSLR